MHGLRRGSAVVVGLLLSCIQACSRPDTVSNNQKLTHPVQGKFLINGQPVRGAVVTFHPQDEPGPETTRSYARTEDDGSFKLSTYQQGDGAPVGRYLITVMVRDADNEAASLPAEYAVPQTSGLKAEIKEGVNDLPPFRLRR
jgi:hypothetical protein